MYSTRIKEDAAHPDHYLVQSVDEGFVVVEVLVAKPCPVREIAQRAEEFIEGWWILKWNHSTALADIHTMTISAGGKKETSKPSAGS
jgi:hypothetical protein